MANTGGKGCIGFTTTKLLGCIRFIDGTLVETQKPWKNALHKSWFNGRKNTYSMNNTMICDHQGLFIYININYLGSYHDVNILQHLSIYNQWCTHGDDYFKYLFMDSSQMGEGIVLLCIGLDIKILTQMLTMLQ